MRALIQRVKRACVRVGGEEVGRIGKGLLVFLGVMKGDGEEDIFYLVDKIVNLRIFEDEDGKINLSLLDVKGEILCVSQFTLLAETRKGRRPSFTQAAPPEEASRLFEKFTSELENKGVGVKRGVFGAHMEVELVNDGPFTIMIDSRERLLPRRG